MLVETGSACLCVFMTVALGCLIGYFVNKSKNEKLVGETCMVYGHEIEQRTCYRECNCHSVCSTNSDGSSSCRRKCSSCPYTCFMGNVGLKWDCLEVPPVVTSAASCTTGRVTGVVTLDRSTDVLNFLVSAYTLGSQRPCFVDVDASINNNPNNEVRFELHSQDSVLTAAIVFFSLAGCILLAFLCAVSVSFCSDLQSSRSSKGADSQKPTPDSTGDGATQAQVDLPMPNASAQAGRAPVVAVPVQFVEPQFRDGFGPASTAPQQPPDRFQSEQQDAIRAAEYVAGLAQEALGPSQLRDDIVAAANRTVAFASSPRSAQVGAQGLLGALWAELGDLTAGAIELSLEASATSSDSLGVHEEIYAATARRRQDTAMCNSVQEINATLDRSGAEPVGSAIKLDSRAIDFACARQVARALAAAAAAEGVCAAASSEEVKVYIDTEKSQSAPVAQVVREERLSQQARLVVAGFEHADPAALARALDDLAASSTLQVAKDRANVKLSELACGETLGKGDFGVVVHATWRGADVAVKLVDDMGAVSLSADSVLEFAGELERWRRLRHVNLVHLFGHMFDEDKGQFGFVMERCDRSLSDMLYKSQDPIDLDVVDRVGAGVARGLAYLHSKGIVHRDVKPQNVLLLNGVTGVKLCDFGMSVAKAETKTRKLLDPHSETAAYLAPELCAATPLVSFKSDVFSLGVLLGEVVERRRPFQYLAVASIPRAIWNGERPPLTRPSAVFPDWLFALIESCWDGNRASRPTAAQVVNIFESSTTNCSVVRIS